MKSEFEIFDAIKREFDKLSVPNSSLFVEKRFGTWIPDFSLFQYEKCICIIEAKNRKPNRQVVLRFINQSRIALSKYEIGAFVLAYPEEDGKIVYLDCTSAVFSHEKNVSDIIDEILKPNKLSLFDVISSYGSLNKTSIVHDEREKNPNRYHLGITIWLMSVVVAIVVLLNDMTNNPSVLSWERVCLVGLVLLFSSLHLIDKAIIRKDGLELYTIAHDRRHNNS